MAAREDAILLKETIRINARKELETMYQSESAILSVLLPDIRGCILDGIAATFRQYIGVICDVQNINRGTSLKPAMVNCFDSHWHRTFDFQKSLV